jgi:hypothetical protein
MIDGLLATDQSSNRRCTCNLRFARDPGVSKDQFTLGRLMNTSRLKTCVPLLQRTDRLAAVCPENRDIRDLNYAALLF